jgi:hypothetical protein
VGAACRNHPPSSRSARSPAAKAHRPGRRDARPAGAALMRPRLGSRAAVGAAGAAETRTSPVGTLRSGASAISHVHPPPGRGTATRANRPTVWDRTQQPGRRPPPAGRLLAPAVVLPPGGRQPTMQPAPGADRRSCLPEARRSTRSAPRRAHHRAPGWRPQRVKLATRCRRQPASRRCREDPLRDGREPLRAQATAATGWRGRVTSWRGSRGPGQRGHGRTSRSGLWTRNLRHHPASPTSNRRTDGRRTTRGVDVLRAAEPRACPR